MSLQATDRAESMGVNRADTGQRGMNSHHSPSSWQSWNFMAVMMPTGQTELALHSCYDADMTTGAGTSWP